MLYLMVWNVMVRCGVLWYVMWYGIISMMVGCDITGMVCCGVIWHVMIWFGMMYMIWHGILGVL